MKLVMTPVAKYKGRRESSNNVIQSNHYHSNSGSEGKAPSKLPKQCEEEEDAPRDEKNSNVWIEDSPRPSLKKNKYGIHKSCIDLTTISTKRDFDHNKGDSGENVVDFDSPA